MNIEAKLQRLEARREKRHLERRAAKALATAKRADGRLKVPNPKKAKNTLERWATRPSSLPLEDYAEGIYSQHGEDGITFEVFRRIGTEHRRAIEICAGGNGGNAGILASLLGWDALLIDGNPQLVEMCRAQHPTAHSLEAFVSRENVCELITRAGFSSGIDYLGIDLDGIDYYVWEVLPLQPRVVIAEFNPLFGPHEAVTIAYEPEFNRKAEDSNKVFIYPKGYYGVSIAALEALGKRKGYQLIGTAPQSSNAYFVREDLSHHFQPCSAAEAWKPGKQGKPREQRMEAVTLEGAANYFARLGRPLVHVG